MYSSIAFFESPVNGTYFIIISWSILVDYGNKILLDARISSTQDFLESSLDLNYFSEERFFPSLLPRWLQLTMASGLIPAETRNSVKAVLNLVYPDLKSSPTTKTLFYLASQITPGTRVFCGDPGVVQFREIKMINLLVFRMIDNFQRY